MILFVLTSITCIFTSSNKNKKINIMETVILKSTGKTYFVKFKQDVGTEAENEEKRKSRISCYCLSHFGQTQYYIRSIKNGKPFGKVIIKYSEDLTV